MRMGRASILLFAALSASAGHAAGPGTGASASFGGRLSDTQGAPLAGPVDLELRFYAAQTGGDPLAVTVQRFDHVVLASGVYQVTLTVPDNELIDANGRTVLNYVKLSN